MTPLEGSRLGRHIRLLFQDVAGQFVTVVVVADIAVVGTALAAVVVVGTVAGNHCCTEAEYCILAALRIH